MDSDSNLVLALLAVRMLGGESVAKTEPVIKAIKSQLFTEAKKQELLKESKVKVEDPGKFTKAGKPATKNVAVYSLTNQGEQYLEQAGSAGLQTAKKMAVLSEFKQQLEADRQQLRDDIRAAQAKTKSAGPTQAEWDKLVKKVDDLAKQMEKWNPTNDSDPLTEKLDAAFSLLTNRISEMLGQATTHKSPEPEPAAPVGESLEDVLHKAYDKLCLFTEFRDGLVELPRLYHESRKSRPDLPIQEFHDLLMEMWMQRQIQLHILNEVYMAAEPEKGIKHNDKLYYYILWKPS